MNNIYTDELCTTKTNEEGRYVFTNLEAGNYCIEMVCEENQLRVVLTWAESPEDLDSHLKINLSNGEKGHVCYWNKSFEQEGEKICVLDVDDTNSYGPETITLCSDDTGDYQYYVHNYSLDGDLESSDATIQVYMPGEAFPKYTFHVPYGDGEYWDVFDYNTSTGRLHLVNKLTDDNNYLE